LATDTSNSIVTATVKNNAGAPVSGVTVNFVVTGDPILGALSVASATTDVAGNAVTTFTGGGGGPRTGDTNVVTATITIGAATYTNAVIITYP
jgi:hypothetical protein